MRTVVLAVLTLGAYATVAAAGDVCGAGLFLCNSADLCVEQHNNCDGHPDCPDGSDEWSCTDEWDSTFWDHHFRKRPAADLDEQPSECGFGHLSVPCECRGRDLLCENMGLVAVPAGLPSRGLNMLDLSGNSFPSVDAQSMRGLPDLHTLVLAHAGVDTLGGGAFAYLVSMFSLYLNNNRIRVLPEPIFTERNNVQSLVVSYNLLEHLPDGAFRNLRHIRELDLRHNLLSDIAAAALEPLTSLDTLYLNENRIKRLTASAFPALPALRLLSLAHNDIDAIQPGAFAPLHGLHNLYLSKNQLTRLENDTFLNLTQLRGLNLNENELSDAALGAFSGLERLASLDLQRNPFQKLDRLVLRDLLELRYVYFDDFRLCAAALHVRVCEPHGDGISSLDHLLDNVVLRASVWLMALVACVGNLLVLLGRSLMREPNAVHSLYIMNLSLSDLLMGCYLFLIATADFRFRGRYVTVEYEWRHSATCSLCGFLSTLSSESSVLILALITWDRLVSVARPLARRQPSVRHGAVHTVALWTVALLVALLPLTGAPYFGSEFYGGNGVCLALHIHDPYAQGWEYSAAMFVLVNALALSFICWAYWRMLRVIRSSGLSLRSNQERQDRVVAKRFAIIVITDCVCWIPVIVLKLVALAGVAVHQDLYAWLAIFVLPINSALNPVLYTLTTKLFKQQFSRLLCTWKRCGNSLQLDSALSLSHLQPGSGRRRVTCRACHPRIKGGRRTALHGNMLTQRGTVWDLVPCDFFVFTEIHFQLKSRRSVEEIQQMVLDTFEEGSKRGASMHMGNLGKGGGHI